MARTSSPVAEALSLTLRKVAVAGSAAALAGAGLLATAVPASAAAYGGQCGSGYTVIRQASVGGLGTVFLTWSRTARKNCVVTIRNSPGARMPMNAWLKLNSESTWQQDPGNFTTYAGPVYRSAAGQCVDWGGRIGDFTVRYTRDACN